MLLSEFGDWNPAQCDRGVAFHGVHGSAWDRRRGKPWSHTQFCRIREEETVLCVSPDKSIIGEYMMSSEWGRRIRLFIQRFWQPASACMTCMPGSWGNIMSLAHWTTALQTGLLTGILAVVLTFTPATKLYAHRYGNALVVGLLTMLGDAYSHPNHYGIPLAEPVVTGVMSGLLTLGASYLFEDRARRLRAAWSRIFG